MYAKGNRIQQGPALRNRVMQEHPFPIVIQAKTQVGTRECRLGIGVEHQVFTPGDTASRGKDKFARLGGIIAELHPRKIHRVRSAIVELDEIWIASGMLKGRGVRGQGLINPQLRKRRIYGP